QHDSDHKEKSDKSNLVVGQQAQRGAKRTADLALRAEERRAARGLSSSHGLLLFVEFDARIEHAVEDIGQKIGNDDGERDHQKNALHDRVVPLGDAIEEHAADALVLEDRFDQDRTADDEPNRNRELGKEGQDGVASYIGGGN